MVRIVERSLNSNGKAKRKLESRRVVSAQGKRIKADLVNPDSESFGTDLLQSFTRSVDRVRRENKLMFGRRDGVDDGKE
jgi:hypothetical protein